MDTKAIEGSQTAFLGFRHLPVIPNGRAMNLALSVKISWL